MFLRLCGSLSILRRLSSWSLSLIQHGDLLTDASEAEYVEIFSQGVCYLLALDDERQECRRLLPSDDERVTREQPNVDRVEQELLLDGDGRATVNGVFTQG